MHGMWHVACGESAASRAAGDATVRAARPSLAKPIIAQRPERTRLLLPRPAGPSPTS
jgi:hypothetical protein